MTRLPAEVRLVLIADAGFAGPERITSLVDAALPTGCGGRIMVVERDKRPASKQADRDRLNRLKSLRTMTRRRGAALVVNQRLDLAMASEAEGIHLPENGLPVPTVRAIAPHLWIGRSCHSHTSLVQAENEGVDWAFLSPIAPPLSKPSNIPPIGVSGFQELASPRAIPVFALGGVTDALVPPLLEAGARGVAVIGHVLGAKDPHRAVSKLLGDC